MLHQRLGALFLCMVVNVKRSRALQELRILMVVRARDLVSVKRLANQFLFRPCASWQFWFLVLTLLLWQLPSFDDYFVFDLSFLSQQLMQGLWMCPIMNQGFQWVIRMNIVNAKFSDFVKLLLLEPSRNFADLLALSLIVKFCWYPEWYFELWFDLWL